MNNGMVRRPASEVFVFRCKILMELFRSVRMSFSKTNLRDIPFLLPAMFTEVSEIIRPFISTVSEAEGDETARTALPLFFRISGGMSKQPENSVFPLEPAGPR